MDDGKGDSTAASIRAKTLPKRLDYYTTMFGIMLPGKAGRKENGLARGLVGFDAPLLVLSGADCPPRPGGEAETAAKDVPGNGFEFFFGVNESLAQYDFIAEAKAKGIRVISDPTHGDGAEQAA